MSRIRCRYPTGTSDETGRGLGRGGGLGHFAAGAGAGGGGGGGGGRNTGGGGRVAAVSVCCRFSMRCLGIPVKPKRFLSFFRPMVYVITR